MREGETGTICGWIIEERDMMAKGEMTHFKICFAQGLRGLSRKQREIVSESGN